MNVHIYRHPKCMHDSNKNSSITNDNSSNTTTAANSIPSPNVFGNNSHLPTIISYSRFINSNSDSDNIITITLSTTCYPTTIASTSPAANQTGRGLIEFFDSAKGWHWKDGHPKTGKPYRLLYITNPFSPCIDGLSITLCAI